MIWFWSKFLIRNLKLCRSALIWCYYRIGFDASKKSTCLINRIKHWVLHRTPSTESIYKRKLPITSLLSVAGLVLTSVCLTLSQGFRHNRLQLEFGSGIKGYPPLDGSACVNIVLDPVINFRVLDWWHPLYPHNDNIQNLLNQD